jgi:hypothetical protein
MYQALFTPYNVNVEPEENEPVSGSMKTLLIADVERHRLTVEMTRLDAAEPLVSIVLLVVVFE